MPKDAYNIQTGFLSVKSGDVTLTGNVVNVQVHAEEPDYDSGEFSLNAISVQPTRYTLTADFVPDAAGTSVTIATKKTVVKHEVTVIADSCDFESLTKAFKATGAPAEHTVSTRIITVDGVVRSKMTVSWEESK